MHATHPQLRQAVDTVLGGDVLIYPTETLYALGCDARNIAAVSRVMRLKGRPENKPLPVIVADLEALRAVALDELSAEVLALGRRFWPGPLSVLVRTRGLAPAARDADGFTSVRVPAHPVARALCAACAAPLVATSANLSGEPGAASLADLDPALAALADLVLESEPWPSGNPASTVVSVLGPGRLQLIRAGAVSAEELKAGGFSLETQD